MYSGLHFACEAASVTVTALAASSSRIVLMSAAYARLNLSASAGDPLTASFSHA